MTRSTRGRGRRHVVASVLLALVLTSCVSAGEPSLRISAARAAVPVSGSSQVVLTIHNEGDRDDELVAVATDAALGVEIHVTEIVDGFARMRQLDRVDLRAGSSTAFRPGGLHLMLVVPDADVVEGATFDLTLHFARSDARTVQVTVVDLVDLAEGSADG